MRLGTCLLPEGLTLQGAHHKLAGFCSALVAGYYAAVDTVKVTDIYQGCCYPSVATLKEVNQDLP